MRSCPVYWVNVIGTLIEIKGREFTVTKMGRSGLTLQNAKSGKEQPVSFQQLLDLRPLIGKIYFAEKNFEAKLQEASPEKLLTVLYRYTTIQRCQRENYDLPANRTVRRWNARMKNSGEFGVMVEALFPGHGGNRTARIT